jgi:hypothetical protein
MDQTWAMTDLMTYFFAGEHESVRQRYALTLNPQQIQILADKGSAFETSVYTMGVMEDRITLCMLHPESAGCPKTQ